MNISAPAGLSRRRLLGLGAAGLSATALVACGGPDTSGKATDSSSSQDYSGIKPAAEIDFWSVHPGASQRLESQLVKAYNSSQSDTTVKLVTAGADYNAVAEKMQAAQTSKSLPGVVTLGFWLNFVLNKSITGLNALATHAELDTKDYFDTLLEDYAFEDEQWMIPYARSTPLFYYNKTHFKRAGLPERAPETWMSFAEWAPKLRQADLGTKHVFEFGSPTEEPSWAFQCNVWGWGGTFSKKFDPTMSSPDTVAAYEWGRNAIFTDKWAGVASNNSAEDFGAGAVSAIVGSTGSLKGILESADGKFEVGTGFLPGGPKKTDDICPTGGAGLAIPSGITPEEQVAAMNFIKFLTNAENTVKFAEATGYMPLRKSADTSTLVKQTPQAKTAIDQLDHTRWQDARKLFPGGNKIINDAQTELFTKSDVDVAKVMKQADTELKTIYERDIEPALGDS